MHPLSCKPIGVRAKTRKTGHHSPRIDALLVRQPIMPSLIAMDLT